MQLQWQKSFFANLWQSRVKFTTRKYILGLKLYALSTFVIFYFWILCFADSITLSFPQKSMFVSQEPLTQPTKKLRIFHEIFFVCFSITLRKKRPWIMGREVRVSMQSLVLCQFFLPQTFNHQAWLRLENTSSLYAWKKKTWEEVNFQPFWMQITAFTGLQIPIIFLYLTVFEIQKIRMSMQICYGTSRVKLIT